LPGIGGAILTPAYGCLPIGAKPEADPFCSGKFNRRSPAFQRDAPDGLLALAAREVITLMPQSSIGIRKWIYRYLKRH
jgi:hypothetical protein